MKTKMLTLKQKFLDELFIRERGKIINKYFNGIQKETMNFHRDVYETWRTNFKINISIALGIISIILSLSFGIISFIV